MTFSQSDEDGFNPRPTRDQLCSGINTYWDTHMRLLGHPSHRAHPYSQSDKASSHNNLYASRAKMTFHETREKLSHCLIASHRQSL